MKSNRMIRIGLACCAVFLVAAAVAGTQGCVATPVVKDVPKPEQPAAGSGMELKTWEDGMQAFRDEDYGKALAVFEALSENGENEAIRNQALYGVAVTRLVLARTPGEYGEAMATWDCWSKLPSRGGEDPHMLTPLLQNIAPPGGSRESRYPIVRKAPVRDMVAHNNLVACKSLLQTRDKELERLKARLETREREIRRLRHQIESLENIHLKFQEKKQEVSTP